jgi:hypothetical protein
MPVFSASDEEKLKEQFAGLTDPEHMDEFLKKAVRCYIDCLLTIVDV